MQASSVIDLLYSLVTGFFVGIGIFFYTLYGLALLIAPAWVWLLGFLGVLVYLRIKAGRS